jgi:hypothetical protein
MQIKNEIERFAPHLKCHILKKASPYPLHKEGEAAPDVIITSYSKLNGWAEYLAGKIKYVVFDEIKSYGLAIHRKSIPLLNSLVTKLNYASVYQLHRFITTVMNSTTSLKYCVQIA